MISLVEGASRQKTPNEIALHILLVGLTIVVLIATVTLVPMGILLGCTPDDGHDRVAARVPDPDDDRRPAVRDGIAGMDRLMRKNVIRDERKGGRGAGDVDVLLLDRPGTITHGNRMASELIPAAGVTIEALAEAAMHVEPRRRDHPRGARLVTLVKDKHAMHAREVAGATSSSSRADE